MIARALQAVTGASSSPRGKYVVLLAWLLLAASLSPQAGRLPSLYDQTLTGRLPAGAPSQQALAFARREFPGPPGTPSLIVLSDPGGLDLGDRRTALAISDWLRSSAGPGDPSGVVSVYTTPQAGAQLISPDGTTMVMVAPLRGSGADAGSAPAVAAIRGHLAAATAGTSLRASVTGPAAIAVDAASVFRSVDLELLLATIALVLVLLVLVYRSPALPLVPLLAVGLVLVVVQGLLALAAGRGLFPVGQMPANIATVLLFGAGTDYTLLVVSRYREELRLEADRHVAMRRTMRAVAGAIASSAGAVLLSMLTLLLAALGLYGSLGWVLATAMAVMLAAGLTLIPALLALAGRAAFWPFVPHAGDVAVAAPGTWERVGRLVGRRPRAAALSGLAVLAALALGGIGAPRSYSLLGAFRAPTGATAGFDTLRGHLPAGAVDPTTVDIQLDGPADDRLAAIDAATAAARAVPEVAEVRSPTRPDGNPPAVPAATLQALVRALPAGVVAGRSAPGPGLPPDERQALGLVAAGRRYVSPGGSAVQLSVVFADDPYGVAAIDRIPVLRDAVARALARSGVAARVLVGGQTAALADTMALSRRDTVVVVAAVLAVVGLVLAALLRSLVAPLFLLGVLTLDFLAVVGLAGAVFGRLTGGDGLAYAVPLYTFVFLVSLGADYTIFLMSRVREEVARHGPRPGVALAVGRTGGVISAAGLILAGTFSVLAGLPLTVLFQLGACVAAGVLLDTFGVRPFIVPGLVLWLGRWAWWPSRPPSPAHPPC